MTNTLKHRQQKIQDKRKHTPRRQFVMEIASRHPFTFYKHQGHISKFPGDTSLQLVSTGEFEALREEFTKQGIQWKQGDNIMKTIEKLFHTNPHSRLTQYPHMSENAEYSDMCGGVKNIYLSRLVVDSENVVCSMAVKGNCYNIYHSLGVRKSCDTVYDSMFITNSRNIFRSQSIHDGYQIYGSSNLIGCDHCIECTDLTNQSYMIQNKHVTPETFTQHLQQRKKHPTQSTSQPIDTKDIEDVTNPLIVFGLKTGNNVVLTGGRGKTLKENFYDTFAAGGRNDFYGCYYPAASQHLYCCANVVASNTCFYSINLESCTFCFGCIGLKNQQFCIFNKPYTKEDRHEKVDQIFSQMQHEGTLGKFFPGSMNPFYFNDTAAYLIDACPDGSCTAFTKEEITAAGYLRRDEEIKVDIPDWMDVVDVKDLGDYEGWKKSPLAPSGIKLQDKLGERGESKDDNSPSLPKKGLGDDLQRTINPSILKKVIRDEHGNIYRVIKMEYDFLVKHGLPLPRKHRLERLKSHFRINHNT